MTEETTQVTEETSPEETQVTETTLEDVYKEAGVTAEPAQPAQAVQPHVQPAQTTQPTVPDVYDSDAMRAYLAQVNNGQTALAQGFQTLAAQLSQFQQAQAKAKFDADISKAVETVNETVKYSKPKVIEAMIDAKAREDSRFKMLWDNRDKNPQAWTKALKVLGNDIAKDFQVKTDPKLEAAQRARKTAQSAMATTTDKSTENDWDGLSDEEFQARWQQGLQA